MIYIVEDSASMAAACKLNELSGMRGMSVGLDRTLRSTDRFFDVIKTFNELRGDLQNQYGLLPCDQNIPCSSGKK